MKIQIIHLCVAVQTNIPEMHACSHIVWTEIRLYGMNKNVKKMNIMSCVRERVHV